MTEVTGEDQLIVVKTKNGHGYSILNHANDRGEAVFISGIFGPHSPHTFAAAPVMLEALRAFAEQRFECALGVMTATQSGKCCDFCDDKTMSCHRIGRARAAIAAAEGGEAMMKENCYNCWFWGRLDGDSRYTDHKQNIATCCRDPSLVQRHKDDWCGQFKIIAAAEGGE